MSVHRHGAGVLAIAAFLLVQAAEDASAQPEERYDPRHYQPRQLTYRDSIWRGRDGRYHCRRSNGTIGDLTQGPAIGGLVGRDLAIGEHRALATLAGSGAGAPLAREIDAGRLRCR